MRKKVKFKIGDKIRVIGTFVNTGIIREINEFGWVTITNMSNIYDLHVNIFDPNYIVEYIGGE